MLRTYLPNEIFVFQFLFRELAGKEVVMSDHKALQLAMTTLQFKQLPLTPRSSSFTPFVMLDLFLASDEETL